MQIGAKLLFAFIAIILVLVAGHSGYSLFADYKYSRETAANRLAAAFDKIQDASKGDFPNIVRSNEDLGKAIVRNSEIIMPYLHHDRAALEKAVHDYIGGKTSFDGFITFIDNGGSVFYCGESPKQSGYSAVDKSSLINQALNSGKMWGGAAAFTPSEDITLSACVPILSKDGKTLGVLVVSTPIDQAFVTGMVTKMSLEQDHLINIDVALLSGKTGRLVCVTPNLAANGGPFLRQLKADGLPLPSGATAVSSWMPWLNLPKGTFEAGNRLWRPLRMDGVSNNDIVAVMLVTTPVSDMSSRISNALMISAGCGIVGLLLAMFFSAGLSRGVNEPLRFLIQRTEEITNQKAALPPLEGLSGEWLQLGEQIDTAVTSMRQTVQSLKAQLTTQKLQTEDKLRQADDMSVQLDVMNRKFSQQSKEISEIGKQVQVSARQNIVQKHKLDSILTVTTEGFLILDQYGNVLNANPVFLNWIGATEPEIAGRLCFDLVKRPGEPPTQTGDGQAFARHGGDPNGLINQFYPEGVVYHRYENRAVEVLMHLQPILADDSTIQEYVMVLHDKSLRSEIAQLRSEIVTMLSENVRAPLAHAESNWALVLSNAAQTMHPSVGQPLAELHGHYESMLAVVDSLLMMYGGFVPPPAMPKDQVILTRLVADCLDEVAQYARTNQLALDYKSSSGLPPVSIPKDVVKSILLQLLKKMISITAAGGRVRVETMIKGLDLRISVSSSGPALPDYEIAELFVGFVQGRHAEDSYSDRLEMYLASNNVERLGGKIWAESEAGRGTVIHFTIPIS